MIAYHKTEYNWAAYYEKTEGRPPRETTLFALDKFESKPFYGFGDKSPLAVDLGCGAGRDSVECLRRGWRVIAIDSEQKAIDKLSIRKDIPLDAQLILQVGKIENSSWPTCDLINSSFALPLIESKNFSSVWKNINKSLKEGGRIACQLFGERDSWFGKSGMTFHNRHAVELLLEGWVVEMLREEVEQSTTVRGELKLWHIFHIVAKKAP
jgi:SAM-dependent methyltransferase